MPIANGYTDLATMKSWLGITDSSSDALLEAAVETASRQIDRMCDRVFYQQAALTKTFTPECSDWLAVDDLVSVTSIATDTDGDRVYESTWLATDYDLAPDNASDTGLPYTSLRTTPRSLRWFPLLRRSTQVTGTWGWPAIPKPVTEACLILAYRLFKRKDSPFGVAGASGVGEVIMISKADPDAVALLAPYRRFRAVAA